MSVSYDSAKNSSLWQATEKPFFPPLSSNLKVDVCVIGAGIAGLSTAYQLAREGRDVVVIDRERLGVGETGLTSAHLSSVLDEGFVKLRQLHGDKGAKLAYESHRAAIDEIERIVHDEKIDCDFQRTEGLLFLGEGRDQKTLDQELEALEAIGFRDVEMVANGKFGPIDLGQCLRYSEQAQFHPLKYLAGLSRAIQDHGGKIFTHAAAVKIESGKPAKVTTAQGYQITANSVVVATNVPMNDRVILQTKMAAYRSYVVALRAPKGQFPLSLAWDTSEPYHYIRVVPDSDNFDLVLVGGEDHRVGHDVHPEDHYTRLEDWARTRLGLEGYATMKWSGQIIEPMDGLAYIGHNPGDTENIFVATGDSGHGLTHGTIAGLLLSDQIAGRENPWTTLYNPSRVNLRGIGNYLKENWQSASPYSDWLTSGEVDSIDDVGPGEGAVVRDGLRKLAVYRDPHGILHLLSATCPHLGGVVRWNAAEKTWDCPCHGSRFAAKGEVLNGPAIGGLEEVGDPRESSREIAQKFSNLQGLSPET